MTEQPIDAYIAHLATAVCGRRSLLPRLLKEARLHLQEEARELVGMGHSPLSAQDMAVQRFGAVAELAPIYRESLAHDAVHRAVTVFVMALLINTVFWHSTMGAGFPPSPELAIVRVLTLISVAGMGWGLHDGWRRRRTELRAAGSVTAVRASGVAVGAAGGLIILLTASLLALEPSTRGVLTAIALVGIPFSCAITLAAQCLRYASRIRPIP